MQDVRLFISVASNRDWKGQFGASMCGLVAHLTNKCNPSLDGKRQPLSDKYSLKKFYFKSYGQSSCLSIVRQKFVDEMIEGDFTHWLALDDDMTFPQDIVERLIKHDVDVATTNARLKQSEVSGTLINAKGERANSIQRYDIEDIIVFGGAIFLAKVDAFRNIPRPHFEVKWSPEHQDYLDCDYNFAALLKINGAKMICDHTTSQHIGHVGDLEYRWPATFLDTKSYIPKDKDEAA